MRFITFDDIDGIETIKSFYLRASGSKSNAIRCTIVRTRSISIRIGVLSRVVHSKAIRIAPVFVVADNISRGLIQPTKSLNFSPPLHHDEN